MLFYMKSLTAKVLFPVLLAVVSLIVFSVYYINKTTFSLLYNELSKRSQETSIVAQKAISSFMEDLLASTNLVSKLPEIEGLAVAKDNLAATKFMNTVGTDRSIVLAAVFDSSGEPLVWYGKDGLKWTGKDFRTMPFVERALSGKENVIIDPILSKTSTGAILVGACDPIRQNGSIVGGVVILKSWSNFAGNLISPIKIGEDGYGFILDEKGSLIQHPKLFGVDLSQYDFIQKALTMENGILEYVWEGREKLMVVSKDPVSGWLVGMSAYIDDIAAGAIEQGTRILIYGILLIAVLAFIIFAVVNILIISPVNSVRKMADSIALGDFSVICKKKNNGNVVSEMCLSIHKIADNLISIIDEMNHSAKKVRYGSLNDRIDPSKYSGAYADLIRNNNSTLDNIVKILDELPIPALAVDKDFSIQYINKLGKKMAGANFEGHNYGFCSDLFKTKHCKSDLCACGKSMIEKMSHKGSTEASPSGNTLFIDYSGIPLEDYNGDVVGCFSVIIDQTEIMAAQKVMEQTALQADEIARKLAEASQEISLQVENTSEGSIQQSNLTMEAASAIEEISLTVKEIANNASSAALNATNVRERAMQGGSIVEQVVVSVDNVNNRARVMAKNLRQLEQQVDNIGNIMTVINDIADQTNLLALNAAIEAARAGDAGRGFAVVADEVRKLAEKTMSATTEVGDSISAIQMGTRQNAQAFDETTKAIASTTGLVSQSGEALKSIMEMTQQAESQILIIASASEQQAATSSELSGNVGKLDLLSRKLNLSMEDASIGVDSLAKLADTLEQVISGLNGNGKANKQMTIE